ncbi:MAG: class I SAM-dependent RNA methyltransferase [Chlamydiae bacterium]|nr:class I SAM-dependent RNA methyltransferase [Chlamydiota bacterium]
MTRLLVDSVAFGGEGVGRQDRLVHFIPFTLPGEEVEIEIQQKKKQFIRARLLKVLKEHPQRVPPPCPYFFTCGGCQLQHASYAYQLEIKRSFLQDAFLRIGKIPLSIPPVIPSTRIFDYRQHITLQLLLVDDRWQLCFSSLDHQPLAIQTCLLFLELKDPFLANLQQALSSLSPILSFQGRLRILKGEQGYIGAFVPSLPFSPEEEHSLYQSLSPFFVDIFFYQSHQPLQPRLTLSYQGLHIHYSPFAFLQNHQEQSSAIYNSLPDLFQGCHTLLDLYCGVGISSLILAQKGHLVVGVEINQDSLSCARDNAGHNGYSIEFHLASAEASTKDLLQKVNPDGILVNPPKEGLSPLVRESLLAPSVQTMVYISCHPATLARDCHFFTTQGWVIDYVQGYDMFPQTTHLETVVKLVRKK